MTKCVTVALAFCSLLSAGKGAEGAANTAPPDQTRTIEYNEHSVPTIHTRMKYTTVFVLPKGEVIMDYLIGDLPNWEVNGAKGTNFAYISPTKAGIRTNLNLVVATGNVYSFLLEEGGNPDLKVFVNAKDPAMIKAAAEGPKWVQVVELESANAGRLAALKQLDEARTEIARVSDSSRKSIEAEKTKAEEEISKFKAGFSSSLVHDYTYKDQKEFSVRAMAHTKEFTYIWADPQETPALYEDLDGKPSLINFSYANGVYVVPKVLRAGWLTVGKHRMTFKREE